MCKTFYYSVPYLHETHTGKGECKYFTVIHAYRTTEIDSETLNNDVEVRVYQCS